MSQEITLKRARAIAYKMLSSRARTCYQITVALQKKGADDELAKQVVAELLEAGYLNDYEFAVAYITTRLEQKPTGPLYFMGKLLSTGIDKALARQVLQDTYPAEREMEEAQRLVEGLKRRGETCPHKIARKLVNRGFNGFAARSAIREEFSACLDITP
jgi:regulatory protein